MKRDPHLLPIYFRFVFPLLCTQRPHQSSRRLSFLVVALLLAACQNQDNATTDEPRHTNVIHQESYVSRHKKDLEAINDFVSFWKNFREAILRSDTAAIISMTRLPIETRGSFTDDPIVKYGQDDFSYTFWAYLNQWDHMSFEAQESELDRIKQLRHPAEQGVRGDSARMGDMTFVRIEGEWKLTRLYLANKTIELLEN